MAHWLSARRTLLPDDGNGLRETAALLRLHAGLIVEVRAVEEAAYADNVRSLRDAGERVEDFGRRVLTPAFVNSHTHLALSFLRGADPGRADDLVEQFYFQQESRLTAGDVQAFTRMGAYQSLLHGVGCVWDHYYFGEAVAAGMRDAGITGTVAPTLQDLGGPGADQWETALDATVALHDSRAAHRAGVFAAVGPHATDTVSEQLMARALEASVEHNLPMHLHLAQSAAEVQRVRARTGCPPLGWLEQLRVLEHAPSLVLAHGLYASRAELSLLDPERHTLVLCPHAQMVFGFVAAVDAWCEHGARWTLATDCAASNDSMSLQKEMRAAAGLPQASIAWSAPLRAMLEGGSDEAAAATDALRLERRQEMASHLSPGALLSRVWQTPGALHPGFRAGALQPGALANIVVWDPDHPSLWPGADVQRGLAMGDTSGAIHAMYVMGRPLGVAGDFADSLLASHSYQDARQEAEDRLRAMGLL